MKTILTTLRSILAELGRPSLTDEPVFVTFLLAVAHALLGAVLCRLGLGWGLDVLGVHLIVPMAYFALKELLWDLRRDGRLWDSFLDTLMVFFGTFWVWTDWELWAFPAAFAATVAAQWGRRRA